MTDEKLKQALAKMLPEQVHMRSSDTLYYGTFKLPTLDEDGDLTPVLDTELLHLCALAEGALKDGKHFEFRDELRKTCDKSPLGPNRAFVSATWQQRATALVKVKGIEV